MSKITFTDDSGNAQDVALPAGITLAVAPPVPVSPPPVTYALTLSIDKDALKVGDTFTLTAVMQGSDGTTKPVNAYRIYGFDASIVNKVAPVSGWQRTFTALAPGTTTIKDDCSGQTAKISVTVLAADAAPPSDPPPADDQTPVSPPPPPVTTSASTDVPSVIADGQSILYHYPMDVTLAAAIDTAEVPGTFGGSPTVVAKIAWNFGDGTNGFGADGRHPYDKPGTYTITGSVNYKDGRIVPFGPLTVTVGT